MAKKDVEKFQYPSHFGSHASMIDEAATAELNDPEYVVLKDEHGLYKTERKKLDNKESDPNRYRESRLGRLFNRKEDKKKTNE